ncbi:unnamed protein product [Cylindrotheca closterium]|uniref:Alpha-type protein kinase domain-containing protein n=1 Tax=Cylindrotheca closterium TaxID=2856 RepID=A0AAD2GDB9_9STRA|nr:unnamed protein product [Cylindrotheca closterium]
MTNPSAAARTNLTFKDVDISREKLGEGSFRECYEGIYIGGHRNTQDAACKRFKSQYAASIEQEFFAQDEFKISESAIHMAECWNEFCDKNKKIIMSQGSVYEQDGRKYLIEPLIRDFTKFNSNSGWIGDAASEWQVRCMEAFTHFTYHKSGGQSIVCDIQGRYRKDKFKKTKCRFELSDPAICSRSRSYGLTDLGEKGIDSFFANHQCNEFCQHTWSRPKQTKAWFPVAKGTSMVSSEVAAQLSLTTPPRFRLGRNGLLEIAEEEGKENKFAIVANSNIDSSSRKNKSKGKNNADGLATFDSLEVAGDHHYHQVVGEVGDSGSDWSSDNGDGDGDNNSGSDWSSSRGDDDDDNKAGENNGGDNNISSLIINKGYAEYDDDEVAGDIASNDYNHDNSYDVYGDDYGSEYGDVDENNTDVFFIGTGIGSDDEKIVGEDSGDDSDFHDDDNDNKKGKDAGNTGENEIIFC